MTQRAQWLAVALVLSAVGALLIVGATVTKVRAIGPGTRAPSFQAVNVATGETVTLGDYDGRVVLINVWATWCGPCEEEMPSMQRLYDTRGPEGLRIVAVSIDVDDPETVWEWALARNLTFDILHDRRGRIQRDYQTTGVPESFVVDRRGIIVKRQIGAYAWDQPASVAMFRRLLEPDPVRGGQ